MKTIGLFGFYHHQNFGDDLMAHIIHRHLSEAGYQVLISGSSELANFLGVERATSVEHLVEASDFCVVGGGAWLSNFKKSRSKPGRDSERECHRLAIASRKHSRPFAMISIGGDDTGTHRGIRTGVVAALSEPNFLGGTCRLRTDLEFLSRFEKPFEYYPDIVLSIGGDPAFTTESNSSSVADTVQPVLINLSRRKLDRPLLNSLQTVSKLIGPKRIVLAHNSPTEETKFRKMYGCPFPHFSSNTPDAMLSMLSQACGVVTYRLHLGIASLGVGTPFLAYNPLPKTQLFLDDVKWRDVSISTRYRKLRRAVASVRRMPNEDKTARLPQGLNTLSQASKGHLTWLMSCIRSAIGG